MVGAGRCCSAITLAWVSLARNHAASPCRPGRQASCDRDDSNPVFCTAQTTTEDSALPPFPPKSPEKGPKHPIYAPLTQQGTTRQGKLSSERGFSVASI